MASNRPIYGHLEWWGGDTEVSILGHTKCNIDFVSGKTGMTSLSVEVFTGTGPNFTILCSFGTHWSDWKWACRSTSLIKNNPMKVDCVACNAHMLRVSVELWGSALLPFSEPHAAVISIVSGCNWKFPASLLKIYFLRQRSFFNEPLLQTVLLIPKLLCEIQSYGPYIKSFALHPGIKPLIFQWL